MSRFWQKSMYAVGYIVAAMVFPVSAQSPVGTWVDDSISIQSCMAGICQEAAIPTSGTMVELIIGGGTFVLHNYAQQVTEIPAVLTGTYIREGDSLHLEAEIDGEHTTINGALEDGKIVFPLPTDTCSEGQTECVSTFVTVYMEKSGNSPVNRPKLNHPAGATGIIYKITPEAVIISEENIVSASLLDLHGRTIKKVSGNGNYTKIPTIGVPTGVYLLKVYPQNIATFVRITR